MGEGYTCQGFIKKVTLKDAWSLARVLNLGRSTQIRQQEQGKGSLKQSDVLQKSVSGYEWSVH